jgi:nucleoside 2-deoxyribosyltransferase
MLIYLCGPINGLTDDEAKSWRDQCKKVFSIQHSCRTIDPMRRDYRGKESDSVNEIVQLDKRDVRRSDAILAYCPAPSVGTSMEILYAWQLDKPVIAIVPDGSPVSPWLAYHSTKIVKTLDEGIKATEQCLL